MRDSTTCGRSHTQQARNRTLHIKRIYAHGKLFFLRLYRIVRQLYTTPVEPYSRSDKSTRPARSRRHVLLIYVLYTHVHIKMLNINAARVSFKFSMARTEQQRNYIAVYFVYEPVVILLEYFSVLLHCWLLQAQCVFDCIN